jgi:tetratricopeptide (TPR) repeat protein
MSTPKVGELYRVKHPSNGYMEGTIYEIIRVDQSDKTVKMVDNGGKTGSWVSWDNLISASKLRLKSLLKHLPSESKVFLSAFDGLDKLFLKEEVKDALILSITDLPAALTNMTASMNELRCQELTSKQPEELSFITNNNISVELVNLGYYDLGLRYSEASYNEDGTDQTLQGNYGWALVLMGHFERASELFKKSLIDLEAGKEYSYYWRTLGLYLAEFALESSRAGRDHLSQSHRDQVEDMMSQLEENADNSIRVTRGRTRIERIEELLRAL